MLYDLEAEECVLGAALLSRQAVEAISVMLVSSDFGSPSRGAIFDAITSLYRQGAAIDAKTVADELRTRGTADKATVSDLIALQSNVPSTGSAARYAQIVARFALMRRLAAEGTELAHAATDVTRDPGELLDSHRARLLDIDSPVLATNPGDLEVDEFLNRPAEGRSPFVIDKMLRRDWRVMITAPEGRGKSVLIRQLTVCAAYGLHPFTLEPGIAVPTLLVDLENPSDVVHDWLHKLTTQAKRTSTGERATASLWHRPGGIDLRKRADRLAFEDVIRRRRPEIVALGPLYKSYTRRAQETEEQVASEVQQVLDDLRTRYNFALVIEHHAAKAQSGIRDLAPYGSSLWLRWPELGLKLVPVAGIGSDENTLRIERWRGDRATAFWPDELVRGDVWPFVGRMTTVTRSAR